MQKVRFVGGPLNNQTRVIDRMEPLGPCLVGCNDAAEKAGVKGLYRRRRPFQPEEIVPLYWEEHCDD